MINAKKLAKIAALRRRRILFPRNGEGLDSCCAVSSAMDKGHFAVYTADERRFVVPLTYLNNPVFRQLLEMSEEEYGLLCKGPIVLPCDSVFMDHVICLIRKGRAGDLNRALLARSCCSSSCLQEGKIGQQLVIH